MVLLRLLCCAHRRWLLTFIPAAAQTQAEDDGSSVCSVEPRYLEKELQALRQELKRSRKNAEKAESADRALKVEKGAPAEVIHTAVEAIHTPTSYQPSLRPPSRILPSRV